MSQQPTSQPVPSSHPITPRLPGDTHTFHALGMEVPITKLELCICPSLSLQPPLPIPVDLYLVPTACCRDPVLEQQGPITLLANCFLPLPCCPVIPCPPLCRSNPAEPREHLQVLTWRWMGSLCTWPCSVFCTAVKDRW